MAWVWDLVERRAHATPDAVCALDESGRSMTFGQLAERASLVASALAERGIGPGTSVCWQLPTWIESLVLTTSLSRLGAVQVPLLPAARERELAVVARQVRPSLVVCPTTWKAFDHVGMWSRLGDETPGHLTEILACDRSLPESSNTAALPDLDAARPAEGEHRWIFFSSGTTGVPKGARHTDDSVLAGPAAFVGRTRLTAADRYPIVFPFTHVGGIGVLVAQLLTGASAVLDDQFDPERTIELMSTSDITIAAGGTPLVHLYLEHQRRRPTIPLFPRLRFSLAGAAPKPPTMHAAARDELGGRGCLSVYGLTEAPFLTISDLDDPDEALAAHEGRPAGGATVRVVGLDGRERPPGEEGEIRARGPQLFAGYLDATLDAEAFDADGWFRTGDLGSVDEMGNVTITGRLKDIVIRNGENIAAPVVEHVLLDHPAVADVAVLGIPDPRTGERCCAVVVLSRSAAPLTLEEVRAFCVEAGLARFMVPERLELVDELPRNAAGKVVKHELRAALLAAG